MIGSMYSGISGLKSHQVKMNVIGNNIANVNTVGFKKSTVNFSETLATTIKGATAPQDGSGGTNAIQVGLGTQVSSITTNFGEGTSQTTGVDTDLRIDGEGFFMASDGGSDYYTRAGNFALDGEGSLVTGAGLKVQGWQANQKSDGTTEITPGTPITDVNIKLGEVLPGKATTSVAYAGNLDQESGIEDMKLTVDDGMGTDTDVDVDIHFTYDVKLEKWNWEAKGPTGSEVYGKGSFTLSDGSIDTSTVSSAIRNANGDTLIDSPITGNITFTEKGDTSNKVEGDYTSNVVIASNEVYDSLGKNHTLSMQYTKVDENIWHWGASTSDGLEITGGAGFITFDALGQSMGNYVYSSVDETDPTLLGTTFDGEGNVINSYPTDVELGITGTDTKSLASYYVPDGINGDTSNVGDVTSPYELDTNGIIRYREFQSDGVTPTTLPTDASFIIPEDGAVMNVQFSGGFSFDPSGSGGALPPEQGANPVKVTPDFSSVTQFYAESTATFESQNGYGMGELETFKIQDNGDIMGYYSNGYKQVVARVSVTKFFNPSGLEKVGNSMYQKTPNSGEAIVMQPGTGGVGGIASQSLEMSNVDLSEEFTDMIIAQRGFQANSKTITTSDEMLQELINLKR